MATIEEARKIRNKYRRILNRLRWNSTLRKTNDASSIYMNKVIEYNQKLKDIGFRTTDVGKVVPITEEWKKAEITKMSEVDRLFAEARRLEPKERYAMINKAILLMSEELD